MERQSWVVWVKNQADMTAYVNQVMELVGGPRNPEPGRVTAAELSRRDELVEVRYANNDWLERA